MKELIHHAINSINSGNPGHAEEYLQTVLGLLPLKVRVEVTGGVAEVTQSPLDVDIAVIDHDSCCGGGCHD